MIVQSLRGHIWPLTNPKLLGIVWHQRQATQRLSLDTNTCTPHVISYGCKKRGGIKFRCKFRINSKDLFYVQICPFFSNLLKSISWPIVPSKENVSFDNLFWPGTIAGHKRQWCVTANLGRYYGSLLAFCLVLI